MSSQCSPTTKLPPLWGMPRLCRLHLLHGPEAERPGVDYKEPQRKQHLGAAWLQTLHVRAQPWPGPGIKGGGEGNAPPSHAPCVAPLASQAHAPCVAPRQGLAVRPRPPPER